MVNLVENHKVPQNLKLSHIRNKDLTSSELEQLISIYKNGYQERWIGQDRYLKESLPNITNHLILSMDSKYAAALDVNINRIISIAVDPKFQGLGLGVKLFQVAAESIPNVWISVGVDAEAMLATVLHAELHYELVEDQEKILNLYRNIKGVPSDFKIDIKKISKDFISQRFAKRGIEKKSFNAFVRSGAIHNHNYLQLIFQNSHI